MKEKGRARRKESPGLSNFRIVCLNRVLRNEKIEGYVACETQPIDYECTSSLDVGCFDVIEKEKRGVSLGT